MSEQDRITRARLIDGKVYVEEPDGTWREGRDESDWNRVRAFTEDEIERMAEEDGTADMPDYVRIVRPFQAAE